MANVSDIDFLTFAPAFMERIWGGQRLRTVLGFPIDEDKNVGEAWLLADHPVHESVVAEGPLEGKTLRELMETDPASLLGSAVTPTASGRFPLLLKILDARDVLSVQVHPDDALAAEMGEPDGGKTEMWHVWDADRGSELICGLAAGTTRDALASALNDGTVEQLLVRFAVEAGDSVYVPAGTVHAIGAGVLLSEIQQNSDLTYRLYDFNRRDPQGNARELHVEKGLRATHFDERQPGKAVPQQDGDVTSLATGPYFSCVSIEAKSGYRHVTDSRSFVILLPKADGTVLSTPRGELPLKRARAVLVPGHVASFTLKGPAPVLLHYVS